MRYFKTDYYARLLRWLHLFCFGANATFAKVAVGRNLLCWRPPPPKKLINLLNADHVYWLQIQTLNSAKASALRRSMSSLTVRSVSRGNKLWITVELKVLTWCQFTPTRSRLLFPASLFSRTFILTFTFGWVWMTGILKVDTPGAMVSG